LTLTATFAGNLKRCRRQAGLSQEEVAIRASLHRTAVGQLERQERVPCMDTLVKLAGALSVSPCDLIAGLAWEPGHVEVGRYRSQAVNREDE
jgi:transcriptional regulator with XRE-family HTH domain